MHKSATDWVIIIFVKCYNYTLLIPNSFSPPLLHTPPSSTLLPSPKPLPPPHPSPSLSITHFMAKKPSELSEYVIQQDEEGEALLATICSLKQQLAKAESGNSSSSSNAKTRAENEKTTAIIPNGPSSSTPTSLGSSLEENGKGTVQRSQE